MATTAILTVMAKDVIAAEYDPSRASVFIEANTEHGLIRVDGEELRIGGRAEKFVNGVATFELVTTDSAEDDFSYRGTITYIEKGSREQGRKFLPISDFPLTADANLAAIPEAWDGITIPPNYRSDFMAEVDAKAAAVEADRAYVEARVVDDLGTTDGQTKALIETPSSLTATALSATIAAGLTNDDTAKRTGYESPGPGGTAGFSVDGAIVAVAPQNHDHRLWANSDSNNTVSVRNMAPKSDSAIKFLDAEAGLERGAIGYHNHFDDVDLPTTNPFRDAFFVESSRFINLDATNVVPAPAQPFRLITTGLIPGQSQGPNCRIAMEASGDTYLLYPAVTFNPNGVTKAVKVRGDFVGVEVEPRLRVGRFADGVTPIAPQTTLDVRGQTVMGYSTADRSGELSAGFPVNIISDAAPTLRFLREGVQKIDLYIQPGRLEFVATDNGTVPLTIQFDGSNNISLGGATGAGTQYGNGANVVAIKNTTQAPNQNPVGGGVVFVEAGALKYRGSSGTTTTLAPA